jgi:BatD DUF11 like domain
MKVNFLIFIFSLNIFPAAFAQDDRTDGIVEDNSDLAPGENADEKIRKNFFLRAEVSKNECYVGEPVMAVFKAYSRLDANSQVLKRPSLSGFSVIEMVDAYNNRPEVERYNGKNYFVHLIRKVQLFPLQPGSFTIEPAEVESVIHLRRTGPKSLKHIRDFFRRREYDASLDRQMVFRSPAVTIRVNALPEKNQPEDFAGAVGDFAVRVQMADTTIAAREPGIVKVVISGTGNFPLVIEPQISWPASAEISGPTVTEQVNKYVYPLSGEKTYQFTIEHRDTGKFVIPPVKFSYFDPAAKTYKTAESAETTYTLLESTEPKRRDGEVIFKNQKETPLHFYYFGLIALVIIGVIIYFSVRPAKKEK